MSGPSAVWPARLWSDSLTRQGANVPSSTVALPTTTRSPSTWKAPVVIDGANVACAAGGGEHGSAEAVASAVAFFRRHGRHCFAFLPQTWAKPPSDGELRARLLDSNAACWAARAAPAMALWWRCCPGKDVFQAARRVRAPAQSTGGAGSDWLTLHAWQEASIGQAAPSLTLPPAGSVAMEVCCCWCCTDCSWLQARGRDTRLLACTPTSMTSLWKWWPTAESFRCRRAQTTTALPLPMRGREADSSFRMTSSGTISPQQSAEASQGPGELAPGVARSPGQTILGLSLSAKGWENGWPAIA